MSFASSQTDPKVASKNAVNKMACGNIETTSLAKSLPKSCSISRPTFHAAPSDGETRHNGLNLLTLNEDVFQVILSHFSYDEVAKLRLVCRHFNNACQNMLNKGFAAVQRYHNRCLKEMKAKLPRRESERRTHPLARHIDVLTGIETRLSLLSMTYYKYTVLGVFCFIPGKVLDECYRVLKEVIVHKNPPKSYELLQELRDISSMAMEHFEEHIIPTLKRHQMLDTTLRHAGINVSQIGNRTVNNSLLDDDSDSNDGPLQPSASTPSSSYSRSTFGIGTSTGGGTSTTSPCSPLVTPGLKLDLAVQQNRLLIQSQRKQIIELKTKVMEYGRKMLEQDKLLHDYGRKLIQLEHKLSLSLSQPAHPASPSPNKTTVMGTTKHRKRSHQDDGGPSDPKRSKTSGLTMSLRQRPN